jgi:hypothetical protein
MTLNESEAGLQDVVKEWTGGNWYFLAGDDINREAKEAIELIAEIGTDWKFFINPARTLICFGIAANNAGGCSFFVNTSHSLWSSYLEMMSDASATILNHMINRIENTQVVPC